MTRRFPLVGLVFGAVAVTSASLSGCSAVPEPEPPESIPAVTGAAEASSAAPVGVGYAEAIQIEVAEAIMEISGSQSGSALDPADPGTLLVEVYEPRSSLEHDVVADLEATVSAICAEHDLEVAYTYGP